jgi:hypothetical protein
MNVEKIIYSPGAFLILGAKLAKNVVGCGRRALKFASGHAARPGWQFFLWSRCSIFALLVLLFYSHIPLRRVSK